MVGFLHHQRKGQNPVVELPAQCRISVLEGSEKVQVNIQSYSVEHLAGTYLVYKEGTNMPQDINDGIKVDAGPWASCTITGLVNEMVYTIRAFSYNANGDLQTQTDGAVVTFMPTKSALPNQSKITSVDVSVDSVVVNVSAYAPYLNFKGTYLVYKEGTAAPDSLEDGTLIDILNYGQYTITGLIPGTTYTIRAFAYNHHGYVRYDPIEAVTVQPRVILPEQTVISVLPTSTSAIVSLRNVEGEYFAGTRLVYKQGTVPPQNETDGMVIDAKKAVSYTILGLTNGITYTVRAFAYNMFGNFQAKQAGAIASFTPSSAPVPLSLLPVGTIVQTNQAKYHGQVIRWLIGHQEIERTKLISECGLTYKPFDAAEPDHLLADYRSGGNNYYSISNIDSWLNSSATAWYSPRHEYDTPPTAEHISSGHHAYAQESGFLSNFSPAFIAAILDSEIPVEKPGYYVNELELITRKIYLPSVAEVGLGVWSIPEGSQWSYFSNTDRRIAYDTPEAAAEKDYSPYASQCQWLLRSQFIFRGEVCYVPFHGGCLMYGSANICFHAIRPALELAASMLVSGAPNADGSFNLIV